MVKPYTKTEDVVCRLKEMIKDLRWQDNAFLPSERRLCDMLGTSRVTLRRALASLEEGNLLQTGSKSRMIKSSQSRKIKKCVSFVASGHLRISLPAWNRLWEKIRQDGELEGYKSKLHLYNNMKSLPKDEFEDADFIIYAGSSDELQRYLSWLVDDSRLIGVYEGTASILRNVVAVDNRAIGEMAAESLIAAGYSKPLFVGWDTGFEAFLKRYAGFKEKMESYDIGIKTAWIKGKSLGEFMRNFMNESDQIITDETDSVFVYSDEGISIIYDIIANKYKVPEEYGIVTVSGSHQGLINYPPIDSVSHGSARVVSALFSLMDDVKKGKSKAENHILVPPSMHEGLTLKHKN